MKKAIVLANGAFPRRSEALQALLQSQLLICCDGAYNRLVESQLFSHASALPEVHVVGDGDSLKPELRTVPPFPTVFVAGYDDQETNDLTKAVRYACTLGVTHVVILGATGLREDHTLGNISLLSRFVGMANSQGVVIKVRMYTDYGYFTPLQETTEVASFPRQQVSIFSLSPDVMLSSEGLRYPLVQRRLTGLWEATLNEALGDHFTLTVEGSGVVLVYQTHQAK